MMLFVFGSLAAMLVGMSKTGVPGLGIVSVLLMALALPGAEKTSMGVMVPLLIVADLLAVFYHYARCDWRQLMRMVPSVAIGMACGSVVLWSLDDALFRVVLAVLILILVVAEQSRRFVRRKNNVSTPKSNVAWWGLWQTWFFGFLAGATTMIGNAAGPVMSVYLMAQDRNKADFMGTYVVFFALVNLSKLPVVVGLGMVTSDTLKLDLAFVPAIFVGAIVGQHLFRIVPERIFFAVVTILNVYVPIQILVTMMLAAR
ncbi:MAG: sulfite exporter TauE/SafE family protein [Thermoguttaceae bacterium]